MKLILKYVYIILFSILIASSSALLILVATENMHNLHATSSSEYNDKNNEQCSKDKNLVNTEHVKLKAENTANTDVESNDRILLESSETTFSPESLRNEEVNEINKANDLTTTDCDNSCLETKIINNENENVSEKIESDENITIKNTDQSQNEPPVAPPDKIEEKMKIEVGSCKPSNALNLDQQTSCQENINFSEHKSDDIVENRMELNTTEDKPIPVFSEWAQKQMEEAEKELEKNVNISMKKNYTNGNKLTPSLAKLRVKNYASPDCGAKIITSNSEAQNTGALLTSSKDEYMLSPCTSRIWFVVELCEAIQAKQIDFANFELFSSSPKNFSVAVSNRFPTRDWSNVGRFIAEDTRNIQSFDLYPHLFGKYIRIDVHSHHNSEHFCPISLLRVYGTSEFEAFDSENRNPYEDLEDDEDLEQNDEMNKPEDHNLFKSASDAVMSIVKKAAQVLSKDKRNQIEFQQNNKFLCMTPVFKNFTCSNCSEIIIKNVNFLLSCKYKELLNLLTNRMIFHHLIKSTLCLEKFEIDLDIARQSLIENWNQNNSNCLTVNKQPKKSVIVDSTEWNHSHYDYLDNESVIDYRKSYYLSLLNSNYLAAMCHILNQDDLLLAINNDHIINLKKDSVSFNSSMDNSNKRIANTIKNKSSDQDLNVDFDNVSKRGPEIKVTLMPESPSNNGETLTKQSCEIENCSSEIFGDSTSASSFNDNPTESSSTEKSEELSHEGVNIFNIVDDSGSNDENLENFIQDTSTESYIKIDSNELKSDELFSSTTPLPQTNPSSKTRDDESQWDTDDKIYSEQSIDSSNNPSVNVNTIGDRTTQHHKSGQHSESVFTRLSNRIKALERNMSLSGQYLEELSRRYKKQVEELQTSFSKTLTAIEDQNRRFTELELLLQKRNALLQSNLDDLNVKLHFWMFVLIIVTTVGLIYIFKSSYSVSLIDRRQKNLYEKFEETKNGNNKKEKQKIKRRKSDDGITSSKNSSKCSKKIRRPSEEAMKINSSYKDLMIDNDECDRNSCCCGGGDNFASSQSADGDSVENLNSCEEYNSLNYPSTSNVRNRKISVCYSKDNQPILKRLDQSENSRANLNKMLTNKSYSDSDAIREEIIVVDDDFDQNLIDMDLPCQHIGKMNESNGNSNEKNLNKQKKKLEIKQIKPKKAETASSKLGRLSSPSFLKSPFNNKKSPTSGTTEPTGWEWIRNGNSNNKIKHRNIPSIQENQEIDEKDFLKFYLNSLDDTNEGKNPSPTVSEQLNYQNSITNSENDSLRTTNSESSSIRASSVDGGNGSGNNGGNNRAGIQHVSSANIVDIDGTISATMLNNCNNIRGNSGKTKTKKQRSFKKMFKKVF